MRWGKEWQRAKSSCEELLVDRNNIGEWTSRLLWKWIKWLWSRFASNSKAAVACLIGFGAYIGMQRPVSFTNRFNGRSIPFHLPYHLAYCLTLSLSLVFGSLKLKSCHRHWFVTTISWSLLGYSHHLLHLPYKRSVLQSRPNGNRGALSHVFGLRTHQRNRFLINKMNLCYCMLFVCRLSATVIHTQQPGPYQRLCLFKLHSDNLKRMLNIPIYIRSIKYIKTIKCVWDDNYEPNKLT